MTADILQTLNDISEAKVFPTKDINLVITFAPMLVDREEAQVLQRKVRLLQGLFYEGSTKEMLTIRTLRITSQESLSGGWDIPDVEETSDEFKYVFEERSGEGKPTYHIKRKVSPPERVQYSNTFKDFAVFVEAFYDVRVGPSLEIQRETGYREDVFENIVVNKGFCTFNVSERLGGRGEGPQTEGMSSEEGVGNLLGQNVSPYSRCTFSITLRREHVTSYLYSNDVKDKLSSAVNLFWKVVNGSMDYYDRESFKATMRLVRMSNNSGNRLKYLTSTTTDINNLVMSTEYYASHMFETREDLVIVNGYGIWVLRERDNTLSLVTTVGDDEYVFCGNHIRKTSLKVMMYDDTIVIYDVIIARGKRAFPNTMDSRVTICNTFSSTPRNDNIKIVFPSQKLLTTGIFFDTMRLLDREQNESIVGSLTGGKLDLVLSSIQSKMVGTGGKINIRTKGLTFRTSEHVVIKWFEAPLCPLHGILIYLDGSGGEGHFSVISLDGYVLVESLRIQIGERKVNLLNKLHHIPTSLAGGEGVERQETDISHISDISTDDTLPRGDLFPSLTPSLGSLKDREEIVGRSWIEIMQDQMLREEGLSEPLTLKEEKRRMSWSDAIEESNISNIINMEVVRGKHMENLVSHEGMVGGDIQMRETTPTPKFHISEELSDIDPLDSFTDYDLTLVWLRALTCDIRVNPTDGTPTLINVNANRDLTHFSSHLPMMKSEINITVNKLLRCPTMEELEGRGRLFLCF